MKQKDFTIPIRRNILEYVAILCWFLGMNWFLATGAFSPNVFSAIIVLGCWAKAVLFGAENLKQLLDAARSNLQHHRFLILMGINMSQMILSFALDFYLLYRMDTGSFAGVTSSVSQAEALFDFFYLSTLNFCFFGYSDILPQTVPAKIVNLTEIVLAFVTVIFLLSDFISLKESLRESE